MKFSELAKLLEENGFRLVKEIRINKVLRQARLGQINSGRLPRLKISSNGNVCLDYEGRWDQVTD